MQRPTSGVKIPSTFPSLVFLLKAAQHRLFHGIINSAGVSRIILVTDLGNPFKVLVKLKLQMKIQRVPW